MRRYLPFVIFPLLFSGCVTTEFFAKQNLEVKSQKLQRILIQFADVQPDYAQYGERQTKAAIEKAFGKTVECYLYSDEFYTGLRHPKEMKEDLKRFKEEKKIDALLICIGRRGEKKETNLLSSPGGGTVYANNDQKQVVYRMELFDLWGRNSAWYSTSREEGNGFLNSYKGLIQIFIDKSVKDLKEKDLLGEDSRSMPDPDNPKQEPSQEI